MKECWYGDTMFVSGRPCLRPGHITHAAKIILCTNFTWAVCMDERTADNTNPHPRWGGPITGFSTKEEARRYAEALYKLTKE